MALEKQPLCCLPNLRHTWLFTARAPVSLFCKTTGLMVVAEEKNNISLEIWFATFEQIVLGLVYKLVFGGAIAHLLHVTACQPRGNMTLFPKDFASQSTCDSEINYK